MSFGCACHGKDRSLDPIDVHPFGASAVMPCTRPSWNARSLNACYLRHPFRRPGSTVHRGRSPATPAEFRALFRWPSWKRRHAMNLKKCSWMFATLLLCPGLGWAQSSWPDFMPRLNSALSQSPVASVVPPDVVVEPPTPDVPPDKARWSGKWSGWACQDQACDTKLVVEKVTAAGATIVYAFASSGIKRF